MPIRNQNWYDLQAARRYPLDDRSTGLDDAGALIRDDILVDCHIRFPDSVGRFAFVQAVGVSGTIVTVLFGAGKILEDGALSTTTIAAASFQKPITTNKNYAITPLIPGVAGWVVFGAGIAENFSGRYSSPNQTLILDRCARAYAALPIQSIGKTGLPDALTDVVNISVAPPIKVRKTTPTILLPVDGEEKPVQVTALEFSLDGEINSLNVNPSEYFLGPCGQRPESGTCPNPPIESINGVMPDCYGNINIRADGIVALFPFQNCGGLAIDLPRGLATACNKQRYAAPRPADDWCVTGFPPAPPPGPTTSSSSSLVAAPNAQSSTSAAPNNPGLSLPFCEPFTNNIESTLVTRRGNFTAVAALAPDKCAAIQVMAMKQPRMALTTNDTDNYIIDNDGNILTTTDGYGLAWAKSAVVPTSSTSSTGGEPESSAQSSDSSTKAATSSAKSSESSESSKSSRSVSTACLLAMHMFGTDGSTTFVDESFFENVVVALGNAAISAAQSKFDGASCYFDGVAGTGLRVLGAEPQNIAASTAAEFTIEAWIYPEITDCALLGNYFGSGSWMVALANGKLRFTNSGAGGGTITANSALTLNTWTHIAVSRTNGVLRLFYNGELVGEAPNTGISSYVNSGGLGVGTLIKTNGLPYGVPYKGYIDDLRIVQRGLYPNSFTLNNNTFTDCTQLAGTLDLVTQSSAIAQSSASAAKNVAGSSSSAVADSSDSSEQNLSSSSAQKSSSSRAVVASSSSSSSSNNYSSSSNSKIISSSSSVVETSSSSKVALTLQQVVSTNSLTTTNLATLKTYATDWAINTDIKTDVRIAPGAVNNAGLVFNYVKTGSVETYMLLKVDADKDTLELLRYNGARFVTEYVTNLSAAGFTFSYAQWYRLTVSPTMISGAVAVACQLKNIKTDAQVSFTVSISDYGVPMGAAGIFADRAYAYFNQITIE